MALLLPLIPDIRTDWYYPSAPTHTYTGFSSRALGQLLRLSKATFAGAFHQAPKVQDVALVTSQSDDAVSDFITWRLMGLWRKKGLIRFVDGCLILRFEEECPFATTAGIAFSLLPGSPPQRASG